MAVVQRWVLVKVRLWLEITVLVCPRLSDSGDVAKTMSRGAYVLSKGVVSSVPRPFAFFARVFTIFAHYSLGVWNRLLSVMQQR